MSFQRAFQNYHEYIKVEKEDLRDKRNILTEKIKIFLETSGHPLFEILNQGSYIYGVGVTPISGQDYDIDVGLVFPVRSIDYSSSEIREWVYEAIKFHTNHVEKRGPCIRVHYVEGYHVDIVIYAKYFDNFTLDNYHLARDDNCWTASDPKGLKQFIWEARQKFITTKDIFGTDQIQRVTRYLKRWNDLAIPEESLNKPTGLAILLMVIEFLKFPHLNGDQSNDFEALKTIAGKVESIPERIVIGKPTPEYEDLFKKLDSHAMAKFKLRFRKLLDDLRQVENLSENDAVEILSKQFGSSFTESNLSLIQDNSKKIKDMEQAIPDFVKPAKLWAQGAE